MRLTLAAGLMTCMSVSTAWAVPLSDTYTSAVFFGDSLSDIGNLGPFAPPAPYFNGQFSNGPVWADRVDDGFAPDATRNYALGGAATSGGIVPGLEQQIDGFQANVLGFGTPIVLGLRPLASVWMGGNNLLGALNAFGADLIADNPVAEAAADAVATQAAADIGAGLQRLIDQSGIRDLLVFKLPDLGQTPRFSTIPGLTGDATALTQTFNDALVAELGGLTGASLNVATIDLFDVFSDIADGTVLPGLTNTDTPCFDGAVTVCAMPDAFLFWDEVHPTAVAHAEIARIVEGALAPVPVPPALPLMAVGVLALCWVGRRRAA